MLLHITYFEGVRNMKRLAFLFVFVFTASSFAINFQYCSKYLNKSFQIEEESIFNFDLLQKGKIELKTSKNWEILNQSKSDSFDTFELKSKNGDKYKFWITYLESGFPEELKYQNLTDSKAGQLLFHERKGYCVIENEHKIAFNKAKESRELTYNYFDCQKIEKALSKIDVVGKLNEQDKNEMATELKTSSLKINKSSFVKKSTKEVMSFLAKQQTLHCSNGAAKTFQKVIKKKNSRSTASVDFEFEP